MRSTGKCDIMSFVKVREVFMKTKIIYISGSEIFDIADIRGAFEEVRTALNLDKNTVLFGVPVDAEDAGFAAKAEETDTTIASDLPEEPAVEPVIETEIIETVTETEEEPIASEETESVPEETPIKKRGRPRKEEKIVVEEIIEPIAEAEEEPIAEEVIEPEEKVVPILSVLSTNEEDVVTEPEDIETTDEETEIIPETTEEEVIEEPDSKSETTEEPVDEDEAKLEKLLSVMTPLEEDILEEQPIEDIIEEHTKESDDDSVDATLEQLATEFIENQDKLASEAKSSTRSKIGKLRNILPFKQSKHKDNGLGDLFGWAGIAANDEDFSVPGFFTSAASKK